MIHILAEAATAEQMAAMREALETYIKVVVDVRHNCLAGGGEMHVDCEEVLLEEGSRQEDLWGANWDPRIPGIEFESLINIRPSQNNSSIVVQDPNLRAKIQRIVEKLMGKP